MRDNAALGKLFDAIHLFAEPHGDAAVAQVIAERFDDLLIGEFEQARALFNERDANAERGEHGGVLDADDAAADHDEGLGERGQVEHLIAVDDVAAVDGHLGREGGLGADGDDDVLRLVDLRAAVFGDADVIGVVEAADAVEDIDAVAGELRFGDIDFGLDDVLDAEGEIGHGDPLLHAIVHAVDGAVVVAGEVEHCLAHGLRGDGAGVDADAADRAHALDHCDLLPLLGRVDSATLSSRARSDDDEVVVSHAQRSRVSKFDEWRTNSASPYPTPPTLRFASSSSFKLR